MKPHMQKVRKATSAIVGAVVVIAFSATALPIPTSVAIDDAQYRVSVFISVLFALLHVGAAILFLMGLKDFRPRLHSAYLLICVALVLLCFTFLQYPIFTFFNAWDTTWFNSGGANLAYLVSVVMIYAAMRQFGNLLGVNGAWMAAGPIAIIAFLLGATGYALSQGPLDIAKNAFDVTLATEFTLIFFVIASLMVTLRIKQSTGPAYTNALAWFFIALLAQTIALCGPLLFEIAQIEKGPILGIMVALTGICYIRAGYVFNKIGSY